MELIEAYAGVLATAVILFCVIIFLWLMLVFGGVFKNPLEVSHKLLKKSIKSLETLHDTLDRAYTKKSDVLLKSARKSLNKTVRFSQQFVYENDDDDRIKTVVSSIKTIDISLALIKKMCFQRGNLSASDVISGAIKELKNDDELVLHVRDEEINYRKSYMKFEK